MKILLSSVFGPYGVDDAYGRKENIMELFHNQVTREQGHFSLRFQHQSFGLFFIAENIRAPAVVLDFPSEQRFIQEIKKGYDYVGLSFIMPNFAKARRMAELVRKHAPETQIVLGGHGTMIPGLERMIEHDHICRGEGVKWFRRLLGEDPDRAFEHPNLLAAPSRRVVGIPLKRNAAVLIPGVGCPNACRFCSTSHFFAKKYTPYYESGQELFDVCRRIEEASGTQEFFVLDENFLKHADRAHELLRLMQSHDKPYRFGIFSSAETIAEVGVEFLARLGVTFIWIGVESKHEIYEKNRGVDLKAMIRSLRDHGIGVFASGILFLEQHDKKTIWEDIHFIVDMESDFVQFMQLGPIPGTRLYEDYDAKGILRKDMPYEEWHGQHHIWFRHPHFTREESDQYLRDAFRYDYDTQGSSLLRLCDTVIRGYENLAQYEDAWMVRRREDLGQVAITYRPLMKTLKKHAHNDKARSLAKQVAAKYDRALGPVSLKQRVLSKVVLACSRRERARAVAGKNVYQPRVTSTKYRMPVRELLTGCLEGKGLANLLHLDVDWSQSRILISLGGVLDRVNARRLGRRIRRLMKTDDENLVLSLERLEAVEDNALRRMLRKIRNYSDRVEVVYVGESEVGRKAVADLPANLSIFLVKDRAESR